MSFYTKKPSSMHSSQIFYKQQEPQIPKNAQETSKLSQYYTKASS